MEIWGHTLFKNEEKWLWYAVSSVIDHVDKLLLWDTGSTDASYKIAESLAKQYPAKIVLKRYGEVTIKTFPDVRQIMLEETEADWLLVCDADEIWFKESVADVVKEINFRGNVIESIVVPTINLVGDIYHRLPESAGRYQFGKKRGHYNLRAVKTSIPGLHSQGQHGVWGWADADNRMIQGRGAGRVAFVDAPYLHTTFLPRGGTRVADAIVPKRFRKLKYEIGKELPADFYYPEVFFLPRPDIVPSPWQVMGSSYKVRASYETPLKKIKRKIIHGKIGY